MGAFGRLLIVNLALLGGAVVLAEQTAPPKAHPSTVSQAATHAAAATGAFTPLATVQEIMGTIIDPSSKVVFGAVSSEAGPDGKDTQKAPQSDAEWANVRRSAMMMVEGANLIMMSGRHIARDMTAKPNEGELPVSEIEKRVARDRAAWNKLAREFNTAAMVAFKAADAKDAEAIFASGEGVDAACENCHLRFWYPDQDKLFDKPKPAAAVR